MKLLFLLTQDLESPSGLGRYLPIAKNLSGLGHEVQIAALHSDFDNLLEQNQIIDHVQVDYVSQMHVLKRGSTKTYFSPLKLIILSLNATIALVKAAVQSDADIIVIGEPHPMNSIAALVAKWIKKTPIALDCDDYETATLNFGSKWQEWIVRNVEDRIPHHVGIISTNTHFMEDRLQTLGVPADRIVYIPNGVDMDRFLIVDPDEVDKLREDLDLTGKKIIAYIGTINFVAHPIDILLDAFIQVHSHSENVVLLIVGGGEDFLPLKSKVASMGIQSNVRMVGRVNSDSIAAYYRLSDVIVDPIHDNDAARGRSPLKLFESWVSEVPYITGDVGDRRGLLGDPMAGILFTPGDPRSLAYAIQDLIQDQAKCETLVKRGRKRARMFDWVRLVPELAHRYQALISIEMESNS